MYTLCILILMATKIRKWGNSYAVRISKEMLRKLDLRDGSVVEINLKPAHKKLTLKELVDQITPQNRHPHLDWGPPMGKEIW